VLTATTDTVHTKLIHPVFTTLFLLCMSAKVVQRGPDSSDGIATDYGLDGPGIESRWGEIFRTRPDRSGGPPSLLYNGYWVFPAGKVARA
jgi:hypothetical protein